MALIGLTHSGKAAASANGSAAADGASALCGAERLPAGVLAHDVLVTVLVEALNALQWTPPDMLVHLMRCVRRVWALAVQDSSLQVRVLVLARHVSTQTRNSSTHLAVQHSRSMPSAMPSATECPVQLTAWCNTDLAACGSLPNGVSGVH
jgi:hypothetical protein